MGRRRLIFEVSRSMSNGFVSWSSQPASNALSRSVGSEFEVKAITGMSESAGSAFKMRVADKPSSTGISRSIKITSGLQLEARFTASRPSRAWRTSWPRRPSNIAWRSRRASISSTRRILAIAGRVSARRSPRQARPSHLTPLASTVWKCGASASRETIEDSILENPAFFSMR